MRNEVAKFRLRGFTCMSCKTKLEVFGMDTPPVECPVCSIIMPLKPDFDQLITTKKVVEPFKAE